MKKSYIAISLVIMLVVAAVMLAIPYIDRGLALQSQTDSEDSLPASMYVKAESNDGGIVSIPAATYHISSADTSYIMEDINRSVIGTLKIKTPNDNPGGLSMVVNFANSGSWMFVETMGITLQRQMGYVVLVDDDIDLDGITVVKIDATGGVTYQTDMDSGDNIDGSNWKVWGVGSAGAYAVNPSNGYKGIIVLVDAGYYVKSGCNVIKLDDEPDMEPGKSVGYSVPGSWKVWGSGAVSDYIIISGDILTKYDTEINKTIYDSLTQDIGQAGKPIDIISVKTGVFDFHINVKYKSQIMVDPTEYMGDNMVSDIQFLINESSPLDYKTLTVKYYANGGSGGMSDQNLTLLSHKLNANTFTYYEHTFKGWSTTIDGDVEYKDQADMLSLVKSTTTTIELYATWEED